MTRFAALAALLLPAGALAQEPASWLFYGEAGAESFDRKPYALVEPGAETRGDGYHLALGATLRLGEGGIRKQDFDEPSDFGAILRIAELGKPGQPLRLVAGSRPEITLGRGTIVGGLLPSADPDHGRLGVLARAAGGGFAFEAMAADVLSANVFGARAELPVGAPFGTDRVVLGATWALGAAPEYDLPAGSPLPITGAVQAAGVDLTAIAFRNEVLTLSPYVEGAAVVQSGAGLHLGAVADVYMGPDTTWSLQAEWRHRGRGYLPHYFDAFYEVERYAYPTVQGPTKLWYAQHSPAGDGLLLSARYRSGATTLGASLEGGGPIEASIFASARLAGGTDLSLRIARRGASSASDVFTLSEGLWAAAELRVPIVPAVYAFATAAQLYRVDAAVGRPAPVASASLGLGAIGGL